MTPKSRLCVESISLLWQDVTSYGDVLPAYIQSGLPEVNGTLYMPHKVLAISVNMTTDEAKELHALLSRVSERVTREIHEETADGATA